MTDIASQKFKYTELMRKYNPEFYLVLIRIIKYCSSYYINTVELSNYYGKILWCQPGNNMPFT